MKASNGFPMGPHSRPLASLECSELWALILWYCYHGYIKIPNQGPIPRDHWTLERGRGWRYVETRSGFFRGSGLPPSRTCLETRCSSGPLAVQFQRVDVGLLRWCSILPSICSNSSWWHSTSLPGDRRRVRACCGTAFAVSWMQNKFVIFSACV